MNKLSLAIRNLETIGNVLGEFAYKREKTDGNYATYLENLGWEMHKAANELKRLNFEGDNMYYLDAYGDSQFEHDDYDEEDDSDFVFKEEYMDPKCPYCCSGCADCLL